MAAATAIDALIGIAVLIVIAVVIPLQINSVSREIRKTNDKLSVLAELLSLQVGEQISLKNPPKTPQ
jgi:hypothetical protein